MATVSQHTYKFVLLSYEALNGLAPGYTRENAANTHNKEELALNLKKDYLEYPRLNLSVMVSGRF